MKHSPVEIVMWIVVAFAIFIGVIAFTTNHANATGNAQAQTTDQPSAKLIPHFMFEQRYLEHQCVPAAEMKRALDVYGEIPALMYTIETLQGDELIIIALNPDTETYTIVRNMPQPNGDVVACVVGVGQGGRISHP